MNLIKKYLSGNNFEINYDEYIDINLQLLLNAFNFVALKVSPQKIVITCHKLVWKRLLKQSQLTKNITPMKILHKFYDILKPWLYKIHFREFEKRVSNVWMGIKVIVAATIIYQFCCSIFSNNYTLKPFSVPKEMEERGLKGTAVIEQIYDSMTVIINFKDSSTSRANAFRQLGKDYEKYKIIKNVEEGKEAGSFDPDNWFKTARKLFGFSEKAVVGQISKNGIEYTMRIQIDKNQATYISANNLSALFQKAAIVILEEINPYDLVDYYIKKNELTKAESILYNLKNRKNKTDIQNFQFLVNDTNWDIAKLQQDTVYGGKIAYKDVLDDSEELLKNHPQDIASYVQMFSSLMSAVDWARYYCPNKDEKNKYKKHFTRTLTQFRNVEKNLHSDYYNGNQAEGFVNMCIGYLLYQFEPDSNTEKIGECYRDAYNKLKTNVFILNNMAYYFQTKYLDAKDKTKKYICRDSCIKYLDEALEISPNDSNIFDTRAECALSFGDTTQFFKYFEKALNNPKPIDGITFESYKKDRRWDERLRATPKFQQLMGKADTATLSLSFQKTIEKKELKTKETTHLNRMHPPQYKAPKNIFGSDSLLNLAQNQQL